MICWQDPDAIEHIAVQSGIWPLLNFCQSFSHWLLLHDEREFFQGSCHFGLRQIDGWRGLETILAITSISSLPMRTLRSFNACWTSRCKVLKAMTAWFWGK